MHLRRISAGILLVVISAFIVDRYKRPGEAPVDQGAKAAAVEPTEDRRERTHPAAPAAPHGSGRGAESRARPGVLGQMDGFQGWLTAWRRADAREQDMLVAPGVELASQRRAALQQLIQSDPERAFEYAIAPELAAELPAAVQRLLEERVDVRGDLEVIAVCGAGEERLERWARIGDRRLRAYVVGGRDTKLTQADTRLQGIVLGDMIAIADVPSRGPRNGEWHGDGVDFTDVAGPGRRDGVLMENSSLGTRDSRISVASRGEVRADGADDEWSTGAPRIQAALPAGWTVGEKRVLWINVDFSDAPGARYTAAQIEEVMTGADTFFRDVSNNRCSLRSTLLPVVVRMPQPKTFYEADPTSAWMISDEALKLAREYDQAQGASGLYNPDAADRWIVVYTQLANHSYSARASIGAKGIWINGGLASTIHELGHNHGLEHAHGWVGASPRPIARNGVHVEYGDAFDVMGSGGMSDGYFNAAAKEAVGYLDSTARAVVGTAGTFRLYRHDHRGAAGLQALTVTSDFGYDYRVEYRRQPPRSYASDAAVRSRLENGVLLHWGSRPSFAPGRGTYLLDMHPGTSSAQLGTLPIEEMSDAPLALGESFTDPDAGIHITPVAKGGTSPGEYMDVRVDFGAVGSNRNPVISALEVPAKLTARADVKFTATATDPDGDTVYFRWDFGDGEENPNTSSVQHRWTRGGDYNVKVYALDGKGGRAVRTSSLTVSDPLVAWTRRDNGITNARLETVIYADGRFLTAGSSGTLLSSPDGIAWTSLRSIDDALRIQDLKHSGTRYVAVGARQSAAAPASLVWWSDDGVDWKPGTLQSANITNLAAVTYGGGRFVAAGGVLSIPAGGTLCYSTDGKVWTEATSPVPEAFLDVHYAAGMFVAVGMNGRIVTSPDGVTWTNRSLPSLPFMEAVGHLNGRWYTSNGFQVWTSEDTVTWTQQSAVPGFGILSLFTTSDGLLLATGGGRIFVAEDQARWDVVLPDTTSTEFWSNITYFDVAEGNGVFVATGWGRIYTAGAPRGPAFTSAPLSRSLPPGTNMTLTAEATDSATLRWQRNGVDIAGATATSLSLTSVQPSTTGVYTAVASTAAGSTTSRHAIVGVSMTEKVAGAAKELEPRDIRHPNGNTFDQILLEGAAASFTADPGQITRLSCLDMSDDVIQLELSGPGTVSVVLDGSSGPAAPSKYNQSVNYMRGHAGIVVTGATADTHLSVFSVGRANAVNQALFRDEVKYDGVADIAFIAILSSDGKFGGLRTANASYWATSGLTGLYAPGVEFTGPVYIGDINASDTATPVLVVGSAGGGIRITGGDLFQANNRPVQVGGVTRLQFADGTTSHSASLPAQLNRARLEQDGLDVTAQTVVNPTP